MKKYQKEEKSEPEPEQPEEQPQKPNTCFVRPQRSFKTASAQLSLNLQKKKGGVNGSFKPPILRNNDQGNYFSIQIFKIEGENKYIFLVFYLGQMAPEEPQIDERLKNIDPKMVELIQNEIMDHGSPVSWDDIAGLNFVKTTVKEIVVFPLLRPDIFHGLRGPPKGMNYKSG